MKSHPFPLSGGSYRVVDGELVLDDGKPTPSASEPDTGDAAAAAVDPIPSRRRKITEE